MLNRGQTNQPPPNTSTHLKYISYPTRKKGEMGALVAVDEETLAQLQTAIKTLKKDVELAEMLLNQLTHALKQAKQP